MGNKTNLYILGINCVYHESSACLVKNGQILTYAEEERLNRIKHGKKSLISNPDILPVKSINYCLKAAKITGSDINKVGFSFSPLKRLQNININEEKTNNDWGTKTGEELFYKKLLSVPKKLKKVLHNNYLDFDWIDHHICHAASSFFISPFSESAVLVIDGIAEFDTAYLGSIQRNGNFNSIREIKYPNSLGFLWEKISKFLGYTEYDAGKIMGLGSYGNCDVFYKNFKKIVSLKKGSFVINNEVVKFRVDDYTELEKVLGIKRRGKNEPISGKHADIVASLQKITEEVILHLSSFLYEETGSENLCFSGGVALNCVANAKLIDEGKFKRVFIPPHCNDAGTSIGAALYLDNYVNKQIRYKTNLFSPYWKTAFSEEEVLKALRKSTYKFKKIENVNELAAKLLSEGELIAYFQGASEIGPRALGNRSILANPTKPNIKEILNFQVKDREFFRPYAAVILKKFANDFFKMPKFFSPSMYYMLFALEVKENKRHLVPGIVHIDNTSRVQLVDNKINPNLNDLLLKFYNLTRIPLLLNTSFNKAEPIVHSPQDALETFARMKSVKYLIINNYFIDKDDSMHGTYQK